MRMRLNLRALARVKVGLGKMHWMAEQILNATAPRDVWPLLHEGKLVGLDKLSGHGQSIEDLVAAVQRAYEAPGKAEMGEPGQTDESLVDCEETESEGMEECRPALACRAGSQR